MNECWCWGRFSNKATFKKCFKASTLLLHTSATSRLIKRYCPSENHLVAFTQSTHIHSRDSGRVPRLILFQMMLQFFPTIWRRQLNARTRLWGADSFFGAKENTHYRPCWLSASDLYINMHVNKPPPSILCHMPATTAMLPWLSAYTLCVCARTLIRMCLCWADEARHLPGSAEKKNKTWRRVETACRETKIKKTRRRTTIV